MSYFLLTLLPLNSYLTPYLQLYKKEVPWGNKKKPRLTQEDAIGSIITSQQMRDAVAKFKKDHPDIEWVQWHHERAYGKATDPPHQDHNDWCPILLFGKDTDEEEVAEEVEL